VRLRNDPIMMNFCRLDQPLTDNDYSENKLLTKIQIFKFKRLRCNGLLSGAETYRLSPSGVALVIAIVDNDIQFDLSV